MSDSDFLITISATKTLMESQIRPPQQDYGFAVAQPIIKSYSVLSPTDGVTSFTVGANDQILKIFETPAIKSFSIARARCRGSIVVAQPAAGAGVNFVRLKKPLVNIFRYQTRGNLYVVDGQQIGRLTQSVGVLNHDMKDQGQRVQREWMMPTFRGIAGAGQNNRPDGTIVADDQDNFPQYFQQDLTATNTASYNFDFPLCDFFPKNTGFPALDKSMAYPEIMQIQLTLGPLNYDCWQTAAGNAAISTLATVSNFQIYLQIEMNDYWIKDTLSKCLSGNFALAIPYLYAYKQPYAASATTTSLSNRFGNSHGQYLRKAYWTFYNQTENSNTSMDHNNINGRFLTSFQEYIDQNAITPYLITCTSNTGLDVQHMEDRLRYSCLGRSENVFQFNWIWECEFDKVDNPDLKLVNKDNYVAGLDLTRGDRQYVINFTLPGNTAVFMYLWIVTERLLSIDATGVHIT